ncbi:MAG: methylenetetrahydrofolate--tRNA-(uracil(54)-C(5))-methyltransferase (FADH(2)-oxidizing) TrmFO [Deltaproteobacteria bacterium]|jgi:methylenetetrahydrofolate--tRNA-(uracil-5-)-methyltransferase|nr:methylenetetrahydrofolate--tRNA-(uracil(54)-C(5))-methyltransferase (FADH(2)-oxidizing) TrmFO [Deltaproteobacteria bacterium]
MDHIVVIGGGLAGCECAYHLARAGLRVTLFEQKPARFSPAHSSENLAELVCSNSLRSNDLSSGVGLLKQEMRELGSLVMEAAEKTRVPAGKALAVDRELFSRLISERIAAEANITLVRREITGLDDPAVHAASRVVVAAGPLASDALGASLSELTGGHLYFYDAIAPIVLGDSVDMNIAFRGTRHADPEGDKPGDYLKCPMNKEEYLNVHNALCGARVTPTRDFEKELHFEGCMPIESLAARGERTLCFGPFKPVGFLDPRTGRRPWALVQLRTENLNSSAYNLVGCQTKLVQSEQARVFRLIPGLAQVEFLRYGSMHRNSYVDAPRVLDEELALRARPQVHLAGQICGVEGYVESTACGLWVGMLLAAKTRGRALALPPPESALGALLGHLRRAAKRFQPSNAHFGLMPELRERVKKQERRARYAERGRSAFAAWKHDQGIVLHGAVCTERRDTPPE